MSIYLDVVCTDERTDSADPRENAVRLIGEILPLVIARYGLPDPVCHFDAAFDQCPLLCTAD